MYQINVTIEGISPLLQHRFATQRLDTLMQGATRNSGQRDFSGEWLEGMYVDENGRLYQPATHLEGALTKAAATFKIKGSRGKSWREPIRAYCYVSPDEIPHLRDNQPVNAPDIDLMTHPDPYLSISVMRVIVQRSAVARSRLMIAPGWQLKFDILVSDEQVRPEVVREILEEAGRAVGIGDFRPRYGRFVVCAFDVMQGTTLDTVRRGLEGHGKIG